MLRSTTSRQLWATALALAILATVTFLHAGTTGKVTGVVRAVDGQPLPGVAVQITGLRLGGVTDSDGRFFILQVPPGTHELQANMVGYRTSVTRDVSVSADRTTILNFTLREETIEVQAVVVTAGRPPIEADVTSSRTTVNARRASEVPVNQMLDVLAYEPGVSLTRDTELNIRGGGATQVRFQVDGLDRTDGLTSKPYTQLNQTLVAEVTLLTGGFNAEYGNVRSGMVNVVTKDGTERGVGKAWVSGVYSMTPMARRQHYGPGAYDEDQFDYRTVLLSDSSTRGPTGLPDPYGAIYWPNLYESTRNDTSFKWWLAPAAYKVFDGWPSRLTTANSNNRGAGVYGKGTRTKPWTIPQMIEAWKYEANLNEQVWGYSNEPSWSLDLAAGWGLPHKLGGIVIGFVTNKEMTPVPALRPYYRDQTFDAKLTLTPLDRLKVSFSYMHGSSVSTGNGTASYDPEMAATAGAVAIGGDATSLRTTSDLLGTVNWSKASYGNNRLNLSYSSLLDATFWQWGSSVTYTVSPRTFATAAFGQTRSSYFLRATPPRADSKDFAATSTYRPPSSFGYGAWLLLLAPLGDWSDINGDLLPDRPTSLADATTPGRVYLENPYGYPAAYPEVPPETIYETRQFVFAPGDTALVVSPQGWSQDGYFDLSGTFWLGEGGSQWMRSNSVQTAARGDITHVTGDHTLKAGAEFLVSDLEYHSVQDARLLGNRFTVNMRDYGGDYPAARPSILGIFLQDKFESQGMIMNFGVRVERFDGGQAYYMPDLLYDNRLYSPLHGKFWFDSLCVAHGWNVNDPAWGPMPGNQFEAWSKFVKNGVPEKFPMPWEVMNALPQRDTKPYWRLTPRFGISHPVSDRTKFFFNYGIFYSMAKPAQMYATGVHDARVGGGSGRFEHMFNPELRPANTTSYEVGFEHMFPLGFVFRATGYTKANVDQVTGLQVRTGSGDGYRIYRNANYEDIRGLEMKFTRGGRFVSGWATYQRIATRSGQTGLEFLRENILSSSFYTPLVTANSPANVVMASVRVGTPVEWGLVAGGWGASILQSYSQSTGEILYNPNSVPRRELPPEYVLRGRDSWGTSAKLTKDIALRNQRRVSLYLDIGNLFNRKTLNGTYMNGMDYLAYIVDRRSQGEKDLRVGDPSTWDALTQPYRVRKADGTYTAWKPPISPRTDWLMFLYPRAYRAGVRFDL